jgi:hypothetical protein
MYIIEIKDKLIDYFQLKHRVFTDLEPNVISPQYWKNVFENMVFWKSEWSTTYVIYIARIDASIPSGHVIHYEIIVNIGTCHSLVSYLDDAPDCICNIEKGNNINSFINSLIKEIDSLPFEQVF